VNVPNLSLVLIAVAATMSLPCFAGEELTGNLNDYLADGYRVVSTVTAPDSTGVTLLLVLEKEDSVVYCQVGLMNATTTADAEPVYISGPWNNELLCLPLVNQFYDGVANSGTYQPKLGN
jgi:hypothetical protein